MDASPYLSTQGLTDPSDDECDEEGEEESEKEYDPEIEPPSSSGKNRQTPARTEETMTDKELDGKGKAKKNSVAEVTQKTETQELQDKPVEGNAATKPSPPQETKNVPPSVPALPAPKEQESTLLAYCKQHQNNHNKLYHIYVSLPCARPLLFSASLDRSPWT